MKEHNKGDVGEPAVVTSALEDILGHRIFAASPKAQDFLRYIVTEALEGRSKALTGVTIAQDVFAKDENFDPMQDSVVRVTARRVRYMLQDYYSQRASEPKVKITIPKGKYRPLFEFPESLPVTEQLNPGSVSHENKAATPKRVGSKSFWAAGILAAFTLLVFIGLMPLNSNSGATGTQSEIASYPSVAVIPFKNQTDDETYAFLEKGLQKQMTEDLSRFTFIRPLAYDGAYESLLAENNPHYDYAITGVLLSVEPEIDLYIKLIDLNKTDIIFEDRMRRAPGQSQYYDALFKMVSDLSGNFGGMEGAIIQDSLGSIQDKIAAGTNALSDLSAFECHSLIDELQTSPSPDLYKTVYTCTEDLLEKRPDNDTFLAVFGWLTYIGAVSHEPVLMARSINPDINAKEGYAMIEEAVTLNPENAWAQQALSSLKFYEGDIRGALKHAELAVLENPANPDNLTWLALCLAHNGNWDRSMSLAQEALDRNPDAPSPYYYAFFLKGLYDNDPDTMTSAALTFERKNNHYAIVYSYLAAVASDNRPLVQKLKPGIDEMASRNDGDIMTVIKARMPSKELQQKAQRLIARGEAISSEVDG